MIKTDKYNYLGRISIDEYGLEDVNFYDKDGYILAIGYQRVVVGERGPYVEFSDRHIVAEQFFVPQDLQWKLEDPHVYYIELRSVHSNVKLYLQVNRVSYADYEVGKYYISPFELYDIQGNVLITRINKQ